MSTTTDMRHARLYGQLRTAHLERAHQLAPAVILYQQRRYDFDEQLSAGLTLVQASPLRAALVLARSRVSVLEINEPLFLQSLPATALALLALGLRRLLGGQRTTVVTYAIGNDDRFAPSPAASLRSRLRRRGEMLVARAAARRIDRIVYGTDAARRVYERALPALQQRPSRTIPALPSPRPADGLTVKDANSVVFLGALSERKGLPLLLAAWPEVRRIRPQARLTVIGKGPLDEQVRSMTACGLGIELMLDPPRPAVFATLDGAQVVVLPSQASPTWREQVGLPIVEALASGCSIVTTTETGLASWLAAHGHSVLAPDSDPGELARAIVEQLDHRRPAHAVTDSLPERDGRLAADDWLFQTSVNRPVAAGADA